MFIFHWLGIFSSDYRNGLADGFCLSAICAIVYFAFRLHEYFRIRRLKKRYIFTPRGTVQATNPNDKNDYCPACFAKGTIHPLDEYYCDLCGYRNEAFKPKTFSFGSFSAEAIVSAIGGSEKADDFS